MNDPAHLPRRIATEMESAAVSFDSLAEYFDERLEARAYDFVRDRHQRGDQNGIYLPSCGIVRHLTLALEPWPELGSTVAEGGTGAIFLHRPWRMTAEQRAVLERNKAGVLAYHLSFDEHFTLGFNPPLASVLGLCSPPEILGYKEGRPLGMLGRYANPVSLAKAFQILRETFGGLEGESLSEANKDREVGAVAVVGAMTDALVREAHQRGAGLYVTGQYRQPAERAVRETGMPVAAVGHLRSEVWGLHALAAEVRARFGIATAVIEPPRL